MRLRCTECGLLHHNRGPTSNCRRCGGLLEFELELGRTKNFDLSEPLSFWRYRPFLPETTKMVTMGEGGTPLRKAERLAQRIGLKDLCLKDETRNPTNSFRDRAAALLVSNALDIGCRTLVCASNGNLGASLAAYCAISGAECHVIIPELVDVGKLAQMLIYDAVVEEYGEILDESIRKVRRVAEETGWYQATAELNPLAVEAQKTIAYEFVEQGALPDWIVVPMGSGETIYSLWKGFKEVEKLGWIEKKPRMIGVQAEECAYITDLLLGRERDLGKSAKPTTRALGILVSEPLFAGKAVETIRESGGTAVTVSDPEILAAEHEIARFEGLFAEPASSATVAAVKKLLADGKIDRSERVACLITGSGLKATDILQALTKKRKTVAVGLDLSTKEKILRILSENDTYGYDLWKMLGKTMTRAAVYQHLNELLKKGLVTCYNHDGRRYFKVGDRGLQVLKAIEEIKILL